MKNIPQKIYLQTGLEDNGESCDDFNELDRENITWCADNIYNDDIQYVLASPEPTPEADIEKDYEQEAAQLYPYLVFRDEPIRTEKAKGRIEEIRKVHIRARKIRPVDVRKIASDAWEAGFDKANALAVWMRTEDMHYEDLAKKKYDELPDKETYLNSLTK